MTQRILLLCLLAVMSAAVAAKDIQVRMLTNGPNGQMLVFDPDFIKAKIGDTVTFLPMQKAGHTSISLLVPDGAKPWKAAPDTQISIKIEKQGVYLVQCDVHKSLGMVAVIQAGKPVNLAEAKKAAAEFAGKQLQNKDRFDKLLAQVK
jgi:pseudoazurin